LTSEAKEGNIAVMKTTTDLATIRDNPELFTWGTIQGIHDLGRYTLVSYTYHRKAEDDGPIHRWHIYVDGKGTSTSADSLESALIQAIAIWNLGWGQPAMSMAGAACKLLEV
jgi:hypothetical protein